MRIGDWSSDVCSSDLTRVLRQSKSSLFVDAGVSSDQGFGTAAVFAFSGDRTSHVDHNRLAMPDAPDPDTPAPVPDHHARPSSTRHFDMRPTTGPHFRSEEHSSELQSLLRISYAVLRHTTKTTPPPINCPTLRPRD